VGNEFLNMWSWQEKIVISRAGGGSMTKEEEHQGMLTEITRCVRRIEALDVEFERRADCWKKRAEKAESSLQGAKTLVTQYRDELRDACDMNTSNEPTALGMMRERVEKAEARVKELEMRLQL